MEVDASLEAVLARAPNRYGWERGHLTDVFVGAGFQVDAIRPGGTGAALTLRVRARRLRTLPDTVGPAMRMLVCGLNPSLFAADAGVGFARPGNRFWPAAVAAGLVTVDRDPRHALDVHGIGMTDLVKQASPGAAGISAAEYRSGLARVERLTTWLRPALVCVVGLSGWRSAADPGATAGPQAVTLAGVPVYLMPNTSGRNASASLEQLIGHFRAAASMTARSSCLTPRSYSGHVVPEATNDEDGSRRRRPRPLRH